jgi:uncharacterized membrane protein
MDGQRFWEIDFLRGTAVTAMVAYNALVLFSFFGFLNLQTNDVFWFTGAVLIAGTFILLSGISSTISWKRHHDIRRHVFRGMRILLLGLAITVASLVVAPSHVIVFGILHLIGISILISTLFLKFTRLSAVLGLMIVLLGAEFSTFIMTSPWLVWLGIRYASFQSLDYFPLFPWLGVMLIGLAIGNTLYSKDGRRFELKELQHNLITFFSFLGRNSLLIYFLHVIVILAVVALLKQF